MSYCTQTDIENIFGVTNVVLWSNLDNQTTTADATRIAAAIAYAGSFIDDRFQDGRFVVPLQSRGGSGLAQITDIAARLAGCWLYESRGMADLSDESIAGNNTVRNHRKYAEKMIDDYAKGRVTLSATFNRMFTNIPTVGR